MLILVKSAESPSKGKRPVSLRETIPVLISTPFPAARGEGAQDTVVWAPAHQQARQGQAVDLLGPENMKT